MPLSQTPLLAANLLIEAVQALSASRSVAEIMQVVKTTARTGVRADGATFVLRDGQECFYADEDAVSPLWKGQRFPMEQCISGWAMMNGRVAVIPDISVDARIPQDARGLGDGLGAAGGGAVAESIGVDGQGREFHPHVFVDTENLARGRMVAD